MVPLPPNPTDLLIVSSSFHMSQGALEITEVKATAAHLDISLRLIGKREGALFFYSPKPGSIHAGSFTPEVVAKNGVSIFRLPLSFTDQCALAIDFKEKSP